MPVTAAYPAAKKLEARELCQRGLSFGEISCKIAVPKNTVLGWVKDIKLTPGQQRRIKLKEIIAAARGRRLAAEANRDSFRKIL